MVTGLELPPGDPDAIDNALRQLVTVANHLKTQETSLKNAFAHALESWQAPRADDFRNASAGIQVQVRMAQSTVETSVTLIGAYAKALRAARTDIAGLGQQAATRQHQAETRTATMDPNSTEIDREFQHAGQYVAGLVSHAAEIRSHLKTLGDNTAAAIDAGTNTAVPGGSTLSPDAIRAKVDHAYGIEGTEAALKGQKLTADAAWAALDTPEKALKPEDVKVDGEPDWKEIIRASNDQAVTAWAIGTAPRAGWALGQLAKNFADYKAAMAKLPISYAEVTGASLDTGRIYASVNDILGGIEDSVAWTSADSKAAGASFDLWKATEAAGEGGLPKGLMTGVGHVFSVLGAAGDIMTIIDPGVDNETEGNVLRGTAAANLAGIGAVEFGGLAAAALGLDAAVGWVPVAGQVVVVITGLVLAGDWVYHNWDTVKDWGKDVGNFVTDTVPDALGDATHAVGHAADETVHAVGDAASSVGHFVGGLFS